MSDSAPIFISNDPTAIITELVTAYSELTGRVVQPAQVERLLMNAFAYRESLIRQAIQGTAVQNLVAFSSAPVLDYLGELVGVKRIGALPATCTIRFTLQANPSGVTVPIGTRIATSSGVVVLTTDDDLNIAASVLTGTITATAATEGTAGNGYVPGEVKNILDPLPFIATAANTNATAEGAEEETDDNLRERIRLAPASFSSAGPKGAYIFHAKTANQNIIDVAVLSNLPGTVQVYPLMADGNTTPDQVLNAVFEACNDDKVRPLTDTVTVIAPTKIMYALTVRLTLYEFAIQSEVEAKVMSNLLAFVFNKRLKMGQDIRVNQVERECIIDGVYDVEVLNTITDDPLGNIIVAETEYAFCQSIFLQTIGTTIG
jgi:phage-related baseplate assembly protein